MPVIDEDKYVQHDLHIQLSAPDLHRLISGINLMMSECMQFENDANKQELHQQSIEATLERITLKQLLDKMYALSDIINDDYEKYIDEYYPDENEDE